MDPQFLETFQSIALSLKAIAKRLDSIAVPIGSIAQSSQKLDGVAGSLLALSEQAELLISAGMKQNRRVEGLLGDLIDVSSSPQTTVIRRDRTGKVTESTRTIDTPIDA